MTKAVIIPWSGGMDSTTLLLQHLIKGDVDHIYTCYIELEGNTRKIACEKNTIDILTEHINDSVWPQRKNQESKWTHNTFAFSDYPSLNSSEGIFQPIIWMMYAAFEVGHVALEYDDVEVNIGYVRGDAALRYKSKVIAAWHGISGLTRLDEDPYSLVFPFQGMSKRHIYNRLLKYGNHYDKPFLESTWVCEDPIKIADLTGTGYKRCGECPPCNRDPRFNLKLVSDKA